MKKVKGIKLAAVAVASTIFATACTQEEISFLLSMLNTVANENPYISKEDQRAHDALAFVSDLHTDTANFAIADSEDYSMILGEKDGKGKRKANDKGHLDLQRLVEGNTALQVFALINGGSLDQLNDETFTTKVWDDNKNRYVEKEFILSDWERNADSDYFSGPEDMQSYAEQYTSWGMPRPPLQYAFNALGHSCENWFTKKAGEEWHGAPYVNDWPKYAQDRLQYDSNGEQRCYPSDVDSDHDYHVSWAKTHVKGLEKAAEISQLEENKIRIIKSVNDLEELINVRKYDKKQVGVLIATEGVYAENLLNQPDIAAATEKLFVKLYNQGYRMFSLTHFIDNELGGSSTGMGDLSANAPYGPYQEDGSEWDGKPRGQKLGLSPAGEKFVELMFDNGVMVDVAHSSEGLINRVIEIAIEKRQPIINSHMGMRFHDPKIRNITDEQLIKMASTGGVIGLGLSKFFVGGDQPIDIANAYRYMVDKIDNAKIHKFNDPSLPIVKGIDVVGLGSDFDGGIDATVDASNLAAITRALTCDYHWFWRPNCLKDNFSKQAGKNGEPSELAKIMGENNKRVFFELLPQSTKVIY